MHEETSKAFQTNAPDLEASLHIRLNLLSEEIFGWLSLHVINLIHNVSLQFTFYTGPVACLFCRALDKFLYLIIQSLEIICYFCNSVFVILLLLGFNIRIQIQWVVFYPRRAFLLISLHVFQELFWLTILYGKGYLILFQPN